MSKWSAFVPSADRIPEMMRKALRACYSGRPGVVHIDIPESVINGPCEEVPIQQPHEYRRVKPVLPDADQVRAAADLLLGAKLPIIHAGGGVIHAGAFAELQELAELLHAPVCTSWGARGVMPESHELAWPMVHMEANTALRNAADVMLVLGARLGETDWWGKAPLLGAARRTEDDPGRPRRSRAGPQPAGGRGRPRLHPPVPSGPHRGRARTRWARPT